MQASRCHACGLSPLLLGVAKKALAFGGLNGLLENPQTELLPSQSALIAGVIRFCSSLIENHVSEGRRSVGPSRVSSSRSEPESDSQFDMILRKQGVVHDSLMNDKEISDATVLAIQEPQARAVHGRLLTTSMGHHKWIKMVPSTWREGRWAVRSMLWINKDVEAEQVPTGSPDIWSQKVLFDITKNHKTGRKLSRQCGKLQ